MDCKNSTQCRSMAHPTMVKKLLKQNLPLIARQCINIGHVIHQWKSHEERNIMVAKILKNNIILFSVKLQKRTYMENFRPFLTTLLLSTLTAEQNASLRDSQEWAGVSSGDNLKIFHSGHVKVIKNLKIRFLKTFELKIF